MNARTAHARRLLRHGAKNNAVSRAAETNRMFLERLRARTAMLGESTEEITRRVERESLQALWSKP